MEDTSTNEDLSEVSNETYTDIEQEEVASWEAFVEDVEANTEFFNQEDTEAYVVRNYNPPVRKS